jgi:plastocyanin
VNAGRSRLPAALVALSAAAALTGCAGTPATETADGPSPASSAAAGASAAPSSAAGQRIEVQVSGGQVGGDTGRVPVRAGAHVTLAITSDVADEVHLHGYDLEAELTPGEPATVSFTADIPGVFEAELHEAGTVLLSLQVG